MEIIFKNNSKKSHCHVPAYSDTKPPHFYMGPFPHMEELIHLAPVLRKEREELVPIPTPLFMSTWEGISGVDLD